MATFKALVLKHHKKADDTFNIKIRVNHLGKSVYISTDIHADLKQISNKYKIKDRSLINRCDNMVKQYYDEVIRMGDNVSLYDAKQLAEFLQRKVTKQSDIFIDFIYFGKIHCNKLIKEGRANYANKLLSMLRSLTGCLEKDVVSIIEINPKNLEKFRKYLLSEKTYTRSNNWGTLSTFTKVSTDSGAGTTITYLRAVFNAAKDYYNDEDKGDIRIKHNPFKKFKIPKRAGETAKRSITPEIIRKIRDIHLKSGSRAELGRDVFMLSFYLVGINPIDLWNVVDYKNGRLTYKRTKTSRRRADSALISIKVVSEAMILLNKYRDSSGKRVFDFYKRYNTMDTFQTASNIGLVKVSMMLSIEPKVTCYYARHSWATIARNNCRISMDDIAMALNHVDNTHAITDIYIKKDWLIIDDANEKVMMLINSAS